MTDVTSLAPDPLHGPCVASASTVEAAIDAIFETLRALGSALAERQRTAKGFTSSHLVELQPALFEALDTHASFDSCGYVFAEGALADRPRYLEWWHRGDGERSYQPLILELEVGTPDCYDYYTMDWFQAAVRERRRFVSGPLIDLPCAAVYVMTFSDPVLSDRGDLVGIAGADVALSRLEDQLLPPLLDLPAPAVLVTAERRVIMSNDARWTTGERVATLPGTDPRHWVTAVPVTADLGWMLGVART